MANLLEIKTKDTRTIEIADPFIGGNMGMSVDIRPAHHPLVAAAKKAGEIALRNAIMTGVSAEEVDAISEENVVNILTAVVAGWRVEKGAKLAGKTEIDELEFSEENVRALMRSELLRPIRNQIDREANRIVDFFEI